MRVLDGPDDWKALRVPKWIVKEKYHFEKLPKEPLVVRAILGTPYVPAETDGTIHLDGLLAAAVFSSLPYPPPPFGNVVFPLPLELAWVSPRTHRFVEHIRDDGSEVAQEGGLPLWVASDLRPQGDVLRGQEYWHKRYPVDRADLSEAKKRSANQRAGRWKEYRIPLSTIRTPELRAVCVGHREIVHDLLSSLSHVGKKPAMGYGRVLRWIVEALDEPVESVREAAMKARPVPVEWLMQASPDGEATLSGVRRGGFTPPYWLSLFHDLVSVRE